MNRNAVLTVSSIFGGTQIGASATTSAGLKVKKPARPHASRSRRHQVKKLNYNQVNTKHRVGSLQGSDKSLFDLAQTFVHVRAGLAKLYVTMKIVWKQR